MKCPICLKEFNYVNKDLGTFDSPTYYECENNHKFRTNGRSVDLITNESILDFEMSYRWLSDTWLKTTVNTDK